MIDLHKMMNLFIFFLLNHENQLAFSGVLSTKEIIQQIKFYYSHKTLKVHLQSNLDTEYKGETSGEQKFKNKIKSLFQLKKQKVSIKSKWFLWNKYWSCHNINVLGKDYYKLYKAYAIGIILIDYYLQTYVQQIK